MRIATNLTFDRGASMMGTLTARADALQTAIATGTKLTAPSSDASAYRQLTGLKRAATDQVQDSANITLAQTLLGASDTNLAAIEQRLQRAHELAVQGGSETLSAEQRAALAEELDAIVDDLVKLANATDPSGQPLFAGAGSTAPYVVASNGTVAFAGGGEAGAIPIGDGATIHASTSGERVFGDIAVAGGGTSDMFAIVQGLAARLRAGTSTSGAIDDVKAALSSVNDARASIGARSARLELETERLASMEVAREAQRSAIEDTDISRTITELQKTLTVLQATQASFTKLTQLSLFDYLR